MQDERIALRQDRRRQLGWALGRKKEAKSEFPPLSSDALECTATHLGRTWYIIVASVETLDECVRLFEDDHRWDLGAVCAPVALGSLEDKAGHDGYDDVNDI